jgi:hypothetical protein
MALPLPPSFYRSFQLRGTVMPNQIGITFSIELSSFNLRSMGKKNAISKWFGKTTQYGPA